MTNEIIKNSAARMWNNVQLQETIDRANNLGYKVTRSRDGFTEITDPEANLIIFRSLPYSPDRNID